MIDLRLDLVYSLVNSIVNPLLYILGRVKVLPEDRFGNRYLYATADSIIYLLLLIRRYII